MSGDQGSVILDRLETLQKSINRLDKDLESDRQDIQEFRMRLSGMEGEFNELRKGLRNQANKVSNQVQDVIEPLIDQIEDRTVIEYKNISLWSKLKFWRKEKKQ